MPKRDEMLRAAIDEWQSYAEANPEDPVGHALSLILPIVNMLAIHKEYFALGHLSSSAIEAMKNSNMVRENKKKVP